MDRVTDLRAKEVINLHNGCRLGYVWDIEIDVPDGKVHAIIVPGPLRWFGILGRYEDYCIPWRNIEKIGEDIILVRWEEKNHYGRHRKKHDRGKVF